MSYLFGSYSLVLFLATAMAVSVAALLWPRRDAPGARPLMVMLIALGIWAFAGGFEYAATTVVEKRFWSQVLYLGTTSVPLCFLLFAIEYSREGRGLGRRGIALLALWPTVVLLLAATSHWHGLLWSAVVLPAGTNVAHYEHGPFYWPFVTYNYVLIFSALAILLRTLSRLARPFRGQVGLMMVAALLPLAGNVIYIADLSSIPDVDWTPVAFTLSGVLMGWSIVRLRMFRLVPIARDRLVEGMPDGVLVLDARRQLVDRNPAAGRIFPALDGVPLGQSVEALLEEFPQLRAALAAGEEREETLSLGEEPLAHHYNVRVSPVHDVHGVATGHLVTLRDITDRQRAEEVREELIDRLQLALDEVQTLSGLLPICASCKKIRDEGNSWLELDHYVERHAEVQFSHGICPQCMKELYPEYADAAREQQDQPH